MLSARRASLCVRYPSVSVLGMVKGRTMFPPLPAQLSISSSNPGAGPNPRVPRHAGPDQLLNPPAGVAPPSPDASPAELARLWKDWTALHAKTYPTAAVARDAFLNFVTGVALADRLPFSDRRQHRRGDGRGATPGPGRDQDQARDREQHRRDARDYNFLLDLSLTEFQRRCVGKRAGA